MTINQKILLLKRSWHKKKTVAFARLASRLAFAVGKAREWQYSKSCLKKIVIALYQLYIVPIAIIAILLED